MTIRLNNTAKTFPDGTKALLPTELTVETGEIVSLLAPLVVVKQLYLE
jgi:putative spermidine/putrescine transport system ATP-binding protein